MKRLKPLNCQDFKPLIEQAIKELENGDSRLAVSNYPLKHACFNGFHLPTPSERLSSDYSAPSDNRSLEIDYFEEITLIEKLIVEAKVPINLSGWQKSKTNESGEKMFKDLNRRAYAIQLWDWYAIPWRYKNNAIHIIWSPQDILGTPIIHSYPTDLFLTQFAFILLKQAENQSKVLKQLNFWKSFGIIVSIIIIFLITTFYPLK